MMTNIDRRVNSQRVFRRIASMACAIGLVGLIGCAFVGLPNSAVLSETEFVTVAVSTSVETPLGAGASALADSTWAIYKSSDDSLLFRIGFGSNGEVERLFDSFVFAQPWLGSEIIPDAQAHPTVFVGGSYISGAYAAEAGDTVGVLGVIHGLLLGTHLGTATLSFSGAIDNERIDGTMARTVTIFSSTPFPAPGDARFDAYALRER